MTKAAAEPDLRGASNGTVQAAFREKNPLPGRGHGIAEQFGFAGWVPDAWTPADQPPGVCRDVLGRQPVYTADDDPTVWSFEPDALDDPDLVPAGHLRTSDGDHRSWTLPDPAPANDDRSALSDLTTAIEGALDAAAGAPVAFSGGVDSALVAAGTTEPCYVVGFPESHDVAAARSAADLMDRELRVVELTPEVLEAAIPIVARAIGRTNAMDVSIALPLFLVGERVAADGYDRLVLGQGADELFGGYAKVAKAPTDPRVTADTVRDARREVVGTLPEQLPRDVRVLRAAGVEPVTPLLADDVVAAALALPGHLLVDDRGERKVALRLAARAFIPDRVAFREKKAVQYGSLVSRELDRLARQAGFKRRMNDHVSRYVAARLE